MKSFLIVCVIKLYRNEVLFLWFLHMLLFSLIWFLFCLILLNISPLPWQQQKKTSFLLPFPSPTCQIKYSKHLKYSNFIQILIKMFQMFKIFKTFKIFPSPKCQMKYVSKKNLLENNVVSPVCGRCTGSCWRTACAEPIRWSGRWDLRRS